MRNQFLKNLGYGLADLVTLHKGYSRNINGMPVRFPIRWSRYYESSYEPGNYQFLRERIQPGTTIIDIGAHIGLFSVFCSRITGESGRVICFEPTPGTYKILQQTLKLNQCKNVTPIQAAVGAESGSAVFYVNREVEGCNANSLVDHGEEHEGYPVTITTIDAICDQNKIAPGLIKIDAEGAELSVLKGAMNTLRDVKPLIILGLHPPYLEGKENELGEIYDLVKSAGYEVSHDGASISRVDFTAMKENFDVQLFPGINFSGNNK